MSDVERLSLKSGRCRCPIYCVCARALLALKTRNLSHTRSSQTTTTRSRQSRASRHQRVVRPLSVPAAVLSLTGSAGRAAAHQRSAHIQQQPARVRSLGDYERIIGLGLGSHGPRWAGTTYIRTRRAARRHDESSAAIESALPPDSEPAAVVSPEWRSSASRERKTMTASRPPAWPKVTEGRGGSAVQETPRSFSRSRRGRSGTRRDTPRGSAIRESCAVLAQWCASRPTRRRAKEPSTEQGSLLRAKDPILASADLGALDVRPETSVALIRT